MISQHTTPILSVRRGFTLVELLVVIALIAFLIAITVTAYGNYVQSTRVKASRTTVTKVASILDDRLRAFNIAFEPGRQNQFSADINNYVANGLDLELARIIVRKEKLKQFFPQRFAELDATQVANDGFTLPGTSNSDDETESAEVLYYMLVHGDVLGAAPVADDEFLGSEVADTDKDGWLEFVDSWGNPIRFYRWPTRLVRGDDDMIEDVDVDRVSLLIHDLSNDVLARDPHDPLGLFSAYYSSSGLSESDVHTPDTYYTLLVVSAGPDGELGLYEPQAVSASQLGLLAQPLPGAPTSDPLNSTLNDNVTNRQRN